MRVLPPYQHSVCAQWPDQIHANDSILTFGYSETVLVFLLEAAKKLDFQVSPPMLQHDEAYRQHL